MKNNYLKKAYILSCIAVFVLLADGYPTKVAADVATLSAASCSSADVQAAIDASHDGDTVLIPAGSCTWAYSLVDNKPSYPLTISNKQITLKGAGIDSTLIALTTSQEDYRASLIDVETAKPFRITNFSLSGNISTPAIMINTHTRPFPIGTILKGWRIDHMKFAVTTRAMYMRGYLYGVVDHNLFMSTALGVGVAIENDPNDPLVIPIPGNPNFKAEGNTDWAQPSSLGTDNAVYLEDNTFKYSAQNQGFINDLVGGGRMVIRHNTLENATFQTHGGGHNGRGGLSYEIYDNAFISTNETYRPAEIRAGTGVIFNNTVSGNFDVKNFTIDNERDSLVLGFYGKCDGSAPYDGNTPGETGWPCLDQVGRGSGGTIGNQPSDPLYAWNNGDSIIQVVSPGIVAHLKTVGDPNPHAGNVVDYMNGVPKPGYTPYVYPHPLTQTETLESSAPIVYVPPAQPVVPSPSSTPPPITTPAPSTVVTPSITPTPVIIPLVTPITPVPLVAPVIIPQKITFTQNLKLGNISSEVAQLQHFLNTHGFPVALKGTGSLGQETNDFNLNTQRALTRFQQAYKDSIPTPSGELDASTMRFINGF